MAYCRYSTESEEKERLRRMPNTHITRTVEPLRPEELDALRQCYRQTNDAGLRTRCQMVLLSAQGRPVSEIAQITMFGEDAVLYWIDRYEQQQLAGLEDRPRAGRPPKSG